MDKGLEKGWPESLSKEQSQITLFKSPLIRSRSTPQLPKGCTQPLSNELQNPPQASFEVIFQVWPSIMSQKGLTKPKNRTNSTKEASEQTRGDYQASKTRVLRQIAPESSPQRSAKSLSNSFFMVPFLSPIQGYCHFLRLFLKVLPPNPPEQVSKQ